MTEDRGQKAVVSNQQAEGGRSSIAAFKQTPAEFVLSMKITAIVKWYEDGRISQPKAAAEIAGISRQKFLEHLYEHKVAPYQLTPEDEELIDEVG